MSYTPKHSKETYFDLIMQEEVGGWRTLNPESPNSRGNTVQCFSVVSQHIMGKSKEECLDKVLDAVKWRNERREYLKTLPTFREFVFNSYTPIDEDKEYEFRVSLDPIASMTHSGSYLQEVRAMGEKAYSDRFFEQITGMTPEQFLKRK